MSDRTPEQVAKEAVWAIHARQITRANVAHIVVDALRAEGMLVEEGEVKVRLDGLEERIAKAIMQYLALGAERDAGGRP